MSTSLPTVPIDRHLFLSDLRTIALVDSHGTVSWLCTPRLDGAPLFGSLVGGPEAGYFKISGIQAEGQEYSGQSLVGKTSFKGFTVTDFLDCGNGRSYQRAGRSDLVRIIEGSGEVSVEFAPKFNFGRIPTRLSGIPNGLRIECGKQRLVLVSPGWNWEVSREGSHDVARCTRSLNNESTSLALLIGTASAATPSHSTTAALAATQRFWESWLAPLAIPERYSALVSRSALTLRGLCYGPTGAIAAAGTTSLPETIGGPRNWDYRFCWPRDASFSANALLRLNAPEPAMRLLDWLLGLVLDSEGEQFLAPLYTITGRVVLGEAEIPEAIGYRGSLPVRIGNLASEQLQLDTLGPIAALMWSLAQKGASLSSEHLQLAERLAQLVEMRWEDADSGIWEIRGAQRHYVHSKLMCWYTLRCCADVASYLGVEHEEWQSLAAKIRTQIEERGFNEQLQSYVAAYDLQEADAALLWVVLTGFHPPDHPRSRGTLRFVMQKLLHQGSVYRYHFPDSLQGQEGEFLICRSWLIEALVMTGQRAEAECLFADWISVVGPLGLLAEQWDGSEKCALGNYPQAYSHLGLINSACALSEAATERRPPQGAS